MSSPHVAADPNAAAAASKHNAMVDLVANNDEACTLIAPMKKEHKRSNSYVNNPTHLFTENTMFLKHKRRYCRIEGCNSIVKSQGLCQRHGAKPKTCKVEGCTKQAQGNFDKMCKAHFKAMKRMTTPIPKVKNKDVPPPAQGFSVYDAILPDSLNFVTDEHNNDTRKLPLIVHLKEGFDTLKPPAWHRNEERRARGMFPIDNPAAQLEGWERELVWMEILVLTGVPGASFRHLARAWGRDKGFHMVLAQFICERHGDVERKKRHGEKKGDSAKKKRQKAIMKKTNLDNTKTEMDYDDDDNNNNNGGVYNSSNEDVGADVWDPSLYGDIDTNEALAAEIFDFTEKEFERVVSKYKQLPSSDNGSISTSNSRNISISSTTTDIVVQAAMTAILGQQQPTPGHHRSNSMHSSASNTDHEEIIPTPVHVEVIPTTAAININPIGDPVATTNATNPIQSSEALARLNVAQSYHNQLTPRDHVTPHQHQQPPEPMQQQQQMFQDPSQVQQAPPIQVPDHAYPPQQQQQYVQGQTTSHQIIQQQQQQQYVQGQATSHQIIQQQRYVQGQGNQHQIIQQHQQQQQQQQHVQGQATSHEIIQQQQQQQQQQHDQGQATSHQIIQQQQQQHVQRQVAPHQIIQQQQQQLTGYNMHLPLAAAIQPNVHAQAQLQQRVEPQPATQQISTSIPTPMHQTQQSQAHTAPPFSQQMPYALPPGQQQQQQQQHALTSVPTPIQATQFSQPQVPLIQQQQEQQHQIQQQPI